jgi:hypothetical protein
VNFCQAGLRIIRDPRDKLHFPFRHAGKGATALTPAQRPNVSSGHASGGGVWGRREFPKNKSG